MAGFIRQLLVEIIGDSTSLEKAFLRSARSAEVFNGKVGRSSRRGKTAFDGLGKSIIAAGVGFFALQKGSDILENTIKAGQDAAATQRQLQAQLATSGTSWSAVGHQIEEAEKQLSRVSGFNSDELTRSFTTILRSTQNVNEALRINEIAADVARGRHIGLAQAAIALSKAYGGQLTALKRLGIQVPKNLSGMQALEYVAKRFRGQAAAGATSTDHLGASFHNLEEKIGKGVLPILDKLAGKINDTIDAQQKAEDENHNWADSWDLVKRSIHGVHFALNTIKGPSVLDLFGVHVHGKGPSLLDLLGPADRALFPKHRHDNVVPADTAVKAGLQQARKVAAEQAAAAAREAAKAAQEAAKKATRRAGQRNTWFDAMIGRRIDRVQDIQGFKAQAAELGRIAARVRQEIAKVSDPTRRLTLEDTLVQVLRDEKQTIKDGQDAAQAAAQKRLAAEKKIAEQIKRANELLKQRADAIKNAVLDKLQARQTNILNQRALEAAKEQLRIAKQIGGPAGIKAARQNLQDVNFDILRARIEQAPARLTKAGQFTLGNVITINIHGVTDPNKVANEVAAVLKRRGRRTSNQSRGPQPVH